MISKKIPLHLFLLFFTLIGILTLSGTRIRTEKLHDPRPRILSLVTQVPDGFVKVVDTIDGDTIKVLVDGKEETVRLLGVDTPETKDPRRGVQCFGHAASEFTKSLLMGQAVRLMTDPMEQNRDAFGRLLRYIYLQDGTMINEKLVAEGYAFAYEKFPTSRTERLKLLEQRARSRNLGLWGECNVTIKNAGKLKSTNSIVE